MRRAGAIGDSKLGCILWLAVLAIFVLIAVKAVPVKIAASELYDYMDEQARFGGRASAQALRDRILRKAQDLDLPVERKDVKVAKRGGIIKMNCTFTVPLEFPGYTYNWDFDLEVERQIFIF